MKKAILISLVLLLILNLAGPGYCYGPVEKLGRGIANLITWPLEIPNRMTQANKRSGPYEAATYGLMEGICSMLVRLAAGVFEVATFPFPLPERYEPILNDPELIWPQGKTK